MRPLAVAAGDALPGVADIVDVLLLRGGYNTSVVMVGVALLGVAAGVVGTFAVLRKRAMMSDTLSHATLPGIALAFLAAVALGGEGRSLPLLLTGAALAGIAGIGVVHLLSRHARLPEDAAMGAVLSVFFGLGFVLLSYIQTLGTGAEGGIAKFIYGQTAAMSIADAMAIGAVALLSIAIVALLFKELRLVAFDSEFAGVAGLSVAGVDLALMALVVVVTVIGLQAVGLILVIALVVIPAAAARFWTERLSRMVLLAGAFGAVSGYVGAAISALAPSLPAGGVIVLSAGSVFLLSLLFAPRRGVLAGAFRHVLLRLSIEQQHVLRAAFEASEASGGARPCVVRELSVVRTWSAPWRALILSVLRLKGYIEPCDGGHRLSAEGERAAWRITRNHRLWEAFLVAHADLAPSHVHRSADLVEHVLAPELVSRLEGQLATAGRLPRQPMPESVHPVDPAATRTGSV